MESAAGGIIDSDLDMPQAWIPAVRCLTLPLHSSPVPLDNFPLEERNPFYVELKGVWKVSSPEMKPHIKHDDQEAAAYDPIAELSRKMEGWKRAAETAKHEGKPEPEKPVVSQEYPYRQGFPGGCFNGLIAPIQKNRVFRYFSGRVGVV